MGKSGLILVFVLSAVLTALLVPSMEVEASFRFYVGSREVDLQESLVVNGNILIPVSVLEHDMGAEVESNLDSGEITIKFPMYTITGKTGTSRVLVNGEEQAMSVAPQLSHGEIMVPLRYIVDLLGLRLNFDPAQAILYVVLTEEMADWIASRYESEPVSLQLPDFLDPDLEFSDVSGIPLLNEVVFLGGSRSRVFIDIQGFPAYKSFLLTNPDRMVIDLTDVDWEEPITEQAIDDPIVKRIRGARFDERTIRLVIELNRATDYQINRWPEGGLEVEFNYQMGDIGYYRDDGQNPRIWFYANEQPVFRVQVLPSPIRLVLDFQNTTLLEGAREIQVGDPPLRAIRISQNSPSVARVVLDLDGPMIPVGVEEIDGRYEIVLFEGTEEEYQAKLALETAEPVELYPVIPTDIEIDDSLPLAHRIITVDPGHGGSDPGTIGNVLGVFEKDVVLPIGLELGRLLEENGAIVVYTRNEDRYVSHFDRAPIANMVNAEVLISIHANSYEGTSAKGVETLYNPLYLENFRFAQTVQTELVSHLGAKDRGVRPRTDLQVLNHTDMPAVLVEVGFVSNPEEEALLNDPDYQVKIAEGLLYGILTFFRNYR
ncbi:MAG: AMIN domain-containing protein [Firmicutes bacterium]|jgi:N-acetylmuramoyl-L-alanine amidase|nr:N-acetylmuramoyl-L-alanine amidase family protein [Bacillota bacterium]NLL89047.1 AMIN domain-containing protein [Bacillota bacterium]HKM17035.1 N-acetylmuramoyl-L-alanine amidase family protein [Limnochordia bacterium]